MPVKSPEIIEVTELAAEKTPDTETVATIEPAPTIEPADISHEIQNLETAPLAIKDIPTQTPAGLSSTKISALSLASIRAKKELAESNKSIVRKDEIHLTEDFNETDMLLQWNKYAQRLADKGHKIMESLLLINDPKLKGTTIVHELPNEGSKIDFESEKHDLVGYLRGKLHNHDIDIKIVVNESMDSRKAFTPQDRYNRLNEINPSLDLLRKTFDLDI